MIVNGPALEMTVVSVVGAQGLHEALPEDVSKHFVRCRAQDRRGDHHVELLRTVATQLTVGTKVRVHVTTIDPPDAQADDAGDGNVVALTPRGQG